MKLLHFLKLCTQMFVKGSGTKFVKENVLDHKEMAGQSMHVTKKSVSCWSDIVCTRPCLNRLHQRVGVIRCGMKERVSQTRHRMVHPGTPKLSNTWTWTWSRLSQLDCPKEDNAWSIQSLLSCLFQGQTRHLGNT